MTDSGERVLPRHIAIIMDGNGRWARQRGWERIRGHRSGVRAVREITTYCARLGIDQLTLYSFSSENWKRPKREVDLLMRLLKRFLVKETPTIMDNQIRLRTIGDVSKLPGFALRELDRVKDLSEGNTGMTLCLALNYGARQEIVSAVQRLVSEGADAGSIDEAAITGALDTAGMPDPDLLIRTGGELRISNFLLWQASYAELFFTPVYWPEFRTAHLDEAVDAFAARERRFGALATQ